MPIFQHPLLISLALSVLASSSYFFFPTHRYISLLIIIIIITPYYSVILVSIGFIPGCRANPLFFSPILS